MQKEAPARGSISLPSRRLHSDADVSLPFSLPALFPQPGDSARASMRGGVAAWRRGVAAWRRGVAADQQYLPIGDMGSGMMALRERKQRDAKCP